MSTPAVIGAPPAPLGRRILAAVVDGTGTALSALPISLAVLGRDAGASRPVLLSLTGAILVCAWAGVQWLLLATRGWTLGRRVLGLRVVDVRSGRPIGLLRGLLRGLIAEAGVLACGVGQWVVYASVLWDATGRRRGWHDRVAEAIVVDIRAAPARARLDGLREQQHAWSGASPAASSALGPVPAPAPGPDGPPMPEHTRWAGMVTSGQPVAEPGLVLPPALGTAPSAADPSGTLHDTTQMPVVPEPRRVSPEPAGLPLPGAVPPALAASLSPGAESPPPAPLPLSAPSPDALWFPSAQPPASSGPSAAGVRPPAVAEVPADPGPADAIPAVDSFWSTPVSPPRPVFPTRATAPCDDTTPRPAPSEWAARLPDGTMLDLGGDPVLIGRNPVAPSGLRAVAVPDPGMSVSKTHLVIGADTTGAWVMDRASTNGTLVTLPDGQRIVCLPDQRVRVVPGTVVLFGDLTMTIGLMESSE